MDTGRRILRSWAPRWTAQRSSSNCATIWGSAGSSKASDGWSASGRSSRIWNRRRARAFSPGSSRSGWMPASTVPRCCEHILSRFPAAVRSNLPLLDYLHLRMAEGVLAMSAEDYDRAAAHFLLVQSFEDEIEDGELLAIANFWMGRCRRKAGQYDEALRYTERGENLALAQGYLQMAAIMQASRSWLAFQKGKLDEALAILRLAEDSLNRTDDFLSRGNIQSAYGRIARRQGRYERAVECFERAIAEYRTAGGGQSQLARTLQNLAFVSRLLALEAHKELDRLAASRRSGREGAPEAPDDARERRARIDAIRARSRAYLEEALEIYLRHGNRHGIAGVHINRGYLCLDAGDLERAALEAAEAFAHGHEKCDYIVMARARTLQCIVENAAIDEQVGDPAAPPGSRRDVRARGGGVRGAYAESPDPGARARLAGDVVRGGAVARPGASAAELRGGHGAAAARLFRDGNTSGTIWRRLKARVLQSRRGRSAAAGVERRGRREQVLSADDRGVCADRDSQGLGAGGPQSFARGGETLDFPQESAAYLTIGGSQ